MRKIFYLLVLLLFLSCGGNGQNCIDNLQEKIPTDYLVSLYDMGRQMHGNVEWFEPSSEGTAPTYVKGVYEYVRAVYDTAAENLTWNSTGHFISNGISSQRINIGDFHDPGLKDVIIFAWIKTTNSGGQGIMGKATFTPGRYFRMITSGAICDSIQFQLTNSAGNWFYAANPNLPDSLMFVGGVFDRSVGGIGYVNMVAGDTVRNAVWNEVSDFQVNDDFYVLDDPFNESFIGQVGIIGMYQIPQGVYDTAQLTSILQTIYDNTKIYYRDIDFSWCSGGLSARDRGLPKYHHHVSK